MENKIEKVSGEDIQIGDTVIIDGEMHTVGRKNIIKGFYGVMIYGFNTRKGIDRVLFPKWYQGKLIGYFSQI